MENKIKDKLSHLFSGDSKRIKIIVAIGLIGIVLVFFSEMLPSDTSKKASESTDKQSYSQYTAELEDRLVGVISQIEGVGECKVMITLENSAESVYARNFEEKRDDDSKNQKNEYVFYKSSGEEAPVLIKEYLPKVQGVTVVCSGGNDIEIQERIIKTVTSLFNISTNRVSVSKIKN